MAVTMGEEKKHVLYVTPKEVILNHPPTYFFLRNFSFCIENRHLFDLIQIENQTNTQQENSKKSFLNLLIYNSSCNPSETLSYSIFQNIDFSHYRSQKHP